MALHIIEKREASREEWKRAASEYPFATIFHTPKWAELFMGAQPGRYIAQATFVVFSDEKNAIIPMTVRRRMFGLFSSVQSSPAGAYGGWISEHELSPEHGRLLSRELLGLKDLTWIENPFDPLTGSFALPSYTEDFTQAVNLRMNPDPRIRSSRAHQKALRKSSRSGIIIKKADTWNEYERYYELYQDSLKRWKDRGLPTGDAYPLRLFRLIFETCREQAELWYARKDNETLSGALCFYWNNHAVAWHGAAASGALALRPNNLLYEEMIQDAAKRGFSWFDLNPCGGFRGVAAFKEHLGAQKIPLRKVSKRSGVRSLVGLVQNVRKRKNDG